jgi:hypothetical protein
VTSTLSVVDDTKCHAGGYADGTPVTNTRIEISSRWLCHLPHYLGFLAAFAGLDNPTSNANTRELLGWEPTHPGWVEDVQTGHYFA